MFYSQTFVRTSFFKITKKVHFYDVSFFSLENFREKKVKLWKETPPLECRLPQTLIFSAALMNMHARGE